MTKVRDSQRSKVYAAEKAAVLASWNSRLETLPEIQDYLQDMMNRAWFKRRWPWITKVPRLKDGRGTTHARGGAGGLNLPRWARSEVVVLHEMSHYLCDMTLHQPHAAHGWQFCEVYLTLVRFQCGKGAHDLLRDQFKQHKVRFKPPQTRKPLTEARKAELRAHLVKARAAKGKGK